MLGLRRNQALTMPRELSADPVSIAPHSEHNVINDRQVHDTSVRRSQVETWTAADAETMELPDSKDRPDMADPFARMEHGEEDRRQGRRLRHRLLELRADAEVKFGDDYAANKALRKAMRCAPCAAARCTGSVVATFQSQSPAPPLALGPFWSTQRSQGTNCVVS